MVKSILIAVLFICGVYTAKADHITGGEMYYTLTGNANGQFQYSVTMKLFMRCNSGRQFPNPAIIGVFDKGSNTRVSDIPVPLGRQETLKLNDPSRCITDPPTVCYEVAYYEFIVSLPPSSSGYVIAGQVVFRISGIKNLVRGYGSVGATYTAEIPGSSTGSTGPENSSARFTASDLVIICAANSFSYSFAASDQDNDQLRYSFCEAYQGGSGGGANNSNPPATPPYQSVPYSPEYGGSSPLGSGVHIDQGTGMITGIAPAEAGVYVVTVCVEEVRHGSVIAVQRKDIQIAIAPCTVAEAKIKDVYMLCRDSKTIAASNLSTSPLINTQHWQIRSRSGEVLTTSTNPGITFTFADTGTYFISLVINRGQECSDSASSPVLVYPGFYPAFTSSGICFKKTTTFQDLTTTVYGQVNYWNWNFGGSSSFTVDDNRNPQIVYAQLGVKLIQLIVGNSMGCLDTTESDINIVDKPPLALAFRDTLICVSDQVKLEAKGSGSFSWSPATFIDNINITDPTVAPPVSTTYYIDINDDGCVNRDSVKIRVTNHVSIQPMNDTTICQGDPIRLTIVSDGFKYSWKPAAQVQDPSQKNPVVTTRDNTVYEVTANIGSCEARSQITVNPIPYPRVNAGADTMVCFNTSAQLHATIVGNSFRWSPISSLSNSSSLNPVARPAFTTSYICFANDNLGCPKPGSDTVVVQVLPDIRAFAGRDTTIVTGQELQMKATGGVAYAWSPSTNLSNDRIPNPVAVFNDPSEGLIYKVLVYNEAGCVDSSYTRVKVFKTLPSVFVPNAFSPNGDGINEVLRPISAGIKQIEYFNIYNRWGQLIFSTTQTGPGWNGTLGGKPQESGSFVWVVKAIDYTGKSYLKKGTVTLLR